MTAKKNLHFKKVAIIGVGLIGGSLALAMREQGLVTEVVGVGRGVANLEKAIELGIIDSYTTDIREGVKDADLVFLAVPVASKPAPQSGPMRIFVKIAAFRGSSLG